MLVLRQTATTRADTAVTWRILADHASMARWSTQVFRSRLLQPGNLAPNGVGAIRRVLAMAGPVSEEVTAFGEPERLEYRMTSGPPLVSNYSAVVQLEPRDGGTTVSWTIRFDPRPAWLGAAIRQVVRLSTNRFAADLAGAADRASRTSRSDT